MLFPYIFSLYLFFCVHLDEKRGLESRIFFTWPLYVLQFKQEIFSCTFFWPNKLVNMLFMLCVTPVVSSQMSSPLAIQFLFHKEISAGKSGEIIWRAKTLVVVGTNYKPKSNISVLMHCWSSFGNVVSTHTSCSKTTECNVVEIISNVALAKIWKWNFKAVGKAPSHSGWVLNLNEMG